MANGDEEEAESEAKIKTTNASSSNTQLAPLNGGCEDCHLVRHRSSGSSGGTGSLGRSGRTSGSGRKFALLSVLARVAELLVFGVLALIRLGNRAEVLGWSRRRSSTSQLGRNSETHCGVVKMRGNNAASSSTGVANADEHCGASERSLGAQRCARAAEEKPASGKLSADSNKPSAVHRRLSLENLSLRATSMLLARSLSEQLLGEALEKVNVREAGGSEIIASIRKNGEEKSELVETKGLMSEPPASSYEAAEWQAENTSRELADLAKEANLETDSSDNSMKLGLDQGEKLDRQSSKGEEKEEEVKEAEEIMNPSEERTEATTVSLEKGAREEFVAVEEFDRHDDEIACDQDAKKQPHASSSGPQEGDQCEAESRTNYQAEADESSQGGTCPLASGKVNQPEPTTIDGEQVLENLEKSHLDEIPEGESEQEEEEDEEEEADDGEESDFCGQAPSNLALQRLKLNTFEDVLVCEQNRGSMEAARRLFDNLVRQQESDNNETKGKQVETSARTSATPNKQPGGRGKAGGSLSSRGSDEEEEEEEEFYEDDEEEDERLMARANRDATLSSGNVSSSGGSPSPGSSSAGGTTNGEQNDQQLYDTIKIVRRAGSSASSSNSFRQTLVCSVSPTGQLKGSNPELALQEPAYPIDGTEMQQCRAAFRANRRLIEAQQQEAAATNSENLLRASERPPALAPPPHWAHLNQQCALTCSHCQQRLYPVDKMELDFTRTRLNIHRNCFKCQVCSTLLRLETYAALDAKLYCPAHIKSVTPSH